MQEWWLNKKTMITLRYPYYMSTLPLTAVMPVLLKDDLLWMAIWYNSETSLLLSFRKNARLQSGAGHFFVVTARGLRRWSCASPWWRNSEWLSDWSFAWSSRFKATGLCNWMRWRNRRGLQRTRRGIWQSVFNFSKWSSCGFYFFSGLMMVKKRWERAAKGLHSRLLDLFAVGADLEGCLCHFSQLILDEK